MRPSLAIVVSAVVLGPTAAPSSPSNVMFALQPGKPLACEEAGVASGATFSAAALGDVDGDGALDSVIARLDGADELWLGDGAGGLAQHVDTPLAQDPGPSRDVALGDLDNDGLLDVVVALGPDHANHVYVHVDGAGDLVRLADVAPGDPLVSDVEPSWGVALGDLDGDGRLDVVFANRLATDALYANASGAGRVAFVRLAPGVLHRDVGDSHAVEIDDLDDDGDLDVVIENRDADDFVYLSRGESEFDFMKISVGNGQALEADEDGLPGWLGWLGPLGVALLPPSFGGEQGLGLGQQGAQRGVVDALQ